MYWKGGTGSWHDPMHWSYTSGGLSCGRIPNAADDVVFDGNSFPAGSDTVHVLYSMACRDMSWTMGASGATWAVSPFVADTQVATEVRINGSFTLAPLMVLDLPSILFTATTTGNTITTSGATLPTPQFMGTGGSWIFQDSLLNATAIRLTRGTLIGNGQYLRVGRFISNFNYTFIRELDLSNSIMEITGTGMVWDLGYGGGITIVGGDPLLRFTGGPLLEFRGLTFQYNAGFLDPFTSVSILSGNFNELTVAGSISFGSTTIEDLTLLPGSSIRSSNLISITGSFNAEGTCDAPIHLMNGQLVKQGGTVEADHVIMENFTATGSAETMRIGVLPVEVWNGPSQ